MEAFAHILNWKLLAGSHQFPGKDGGTCINEAAIVAAGFEYQPVRDVRQMPDCFSRPICHLAMTLNDNASDADRQRLLAFVTRLACADTPEVEAERKAYIAAELGPRTSMTRGLEILEGALAIGRQADPLGQDLAVAGTRLEAARNKATTETSVADSPVFKKVKSWLLGKKNVELAN
jgi:hypothetical protein